MAIRLWAVRLDREMTEQEMETLLAFLPAQRKMRLLSVTDRSRWAEPLAAYGLLHLSLVQTYDLQGIPAIETGEKGKPAFTDHPEIQFSISHTKGAVLVGLSETPVGVDIEKSRPVSARVRRRLDAAGETEDDYFRNWVRYEASVKRDGSGISPHPQKSDETAACEAALFPDYRAAASGDGPVEICWRGTLDHLLEALDQSKIKIGRC